MFLWPKVANLIFSQKLPFFVFPPLLFFLQLMAKNKIRKQISWILYFRDIRRFSRTWHFYFTTYLRCILVFGFKASSNFGSVTCFVFLFFSARHSASSSEKFCLNALKQGGSTAETILLAVTVRK